MEVHFLAWSRRAPGFLCVLISLMLAAAAGSIMAAWPRKKPQPRDVASVRVNAKH